MKIMAMRHGQTDWNAQDRIQGKTDIPLNETGREQARRAAELLCTEEKIDVIISSPLVRAKETAKAVADRLGLEVFTADALIERDFGDYEGKQFHEIGCSIKALRRYTDNLPIQNGETIREVAERVFAFLDKTVSEYSDKTLLLVTHGHVLRPISWYFEGIPNNGEEKDILNENCVIHRYEK